METPHQARRLRRRRRSGTRMAQKSQGNDRHVHSHRSGHPPACQRRPCCRSGSAVDRRTHLGQPLRHARDRRHTSGVGTHRCGRARQKPGESGSRTMDRRPAAHLQRRHQTSGSHPPRLQHLRQASLPQYAAMAYPDRAAPAVSLAADHRRPLAYRRQARTDSPPSRSSRSTWVSTV